VGVLHSPPMVNRSTGCASPKPRRRCGPGEGEGEGRDALGVFPAYRGITGRSCTRRAEWVFFAAVWPSRNGHRSASRCVPGRFRASPPVQERNVRRALDDAKTAADLARGERRLSMHSLRHSYASMLATDPGLPATTLAKLTGHADAGFTLRVYARDARETSAVVEDVLARAARAGIGTCLDAEGQAPTASQV
jgi:integrase